ncbi:unnamed protein product [Lactuca saligna]|uniref:Cytochrome c oxidase subunit 5C n=2 Tax=Asteraceae TaxID=4210 RepID=A0AA35ZEG4_LACSI|nr:unnamed protein product [Lactuca saligna]
MNNQNSKNSMKHHMFLSRRQFLLLQLPCPISRILAGSGPHCRLRLLPLKVLDRRPIGKRKLWMERRLISKNGIYYILHLKIPFAIELDKAYPRDFMQVGRVRFILKRSDGSLYNQAISSKKHLMLHVAELVPRHPGRVKKQEPAATSTTGPSKSGKGASVGQANGEKRPPVVVVSGFFLVESIIMGGGRVAHPVLKGPSVVKELVIGAVLGLAAGGLWKMHHWNEQRKTRAFYDLLEKGEISVVVEEE